MGAIDDLITRLRRVDMSEIIGNAIKTNEAEILRLNTEVQLFKQGIGCDNVKLRPEYAALTKRLKKKSGQPINRVTLRDTGEFHENFIIEYSQDSITIKAEPTIREGVDLSQHLAERYGENIYGLTEKHIERTQKIIKPAIIAQILK